MNYNNELMVIIKSLEYKPKLLLHSCCGPCSSYVIDFLKDYFEITILFYNPCIEPVDEYIHRKEEQIRLINEYKKDFNIDFIETNYDNKEYRTLIKGLEHLIEGKERCTKCFYQRLIKTKEISEEYNFEFFGTTLTVSPHKNSKLINEIGLEIADKSKFLVSDFKKNEGYKKSIELSKKYNLYRQEYCGCLFSKNIIK